MIDMSGFLDAVNILVQKTTAGKYAQAAKGIITEVNSGSYTVRLTESDSEFTAVSIDGKQYAVDDSVYVLHTNNTSLSVINYILGKENNETNLVEKYRMVVNTLTQSLLDVTTNKKLVGSSATERTLAIVTEGNLSSSWNTFSKYIRETGLVKFYCTLTADFTKAVESIGIATYGFKVVALYGTNSEYKQYTQIIDNFSMLGNPYAYRNYQQDIAVEIPSEVANSISSFQVYLFLKDVKSGENVEVEITLSEFHLYIGEYDLNKKLKVVISTSTEGFALISGTETETFVTTTAKLKDDINEDVLLSNVKYYWFIKDSSITKDGDPLNSNYFYSDLAGAGWRCLNEKEPYIFNSIAYPNWIGTGPSFTLSSANAPDYENIYKCIARYEGTNAKIVIQDSDEFKLYNFNEVNFTFGVSSIKNEMGVEDNNLTFIKDTDQRVVTFSVTPNSNKVKFGVYEEEVEGTVVEKHDYDYQIFYRINGETEQSLDKNNNIITVSPTDSAFQSYIFTLKVTKIKGEEEVNEFGSLDLLFTNSISPTEKLVTETVYYLSNSLIPPESPSLDYSNDGWSFTEPSVTQDNKYLWKATRNVFWVEDGESFRWGGFEPWSIDNDYFLTQDSSAQDGKTYYQLKDGKFEEVTDIDGSVDFTTLSLYEKNSKQKYIMDEVDNKGQIGKYIFIKFNGEAQDGTNYYYYDFSQMTQNPTAWSKPECAAIYGANMLAVQELNIFNELTSNGRLNGFYYSDKDPSGYKFTEDTSVDPNKTYFEIKNGNYTPVTPIEGDNPKNKGWYEYLSRLYINASYIRTGALTVADDDGKVIFQADVSSNQIILGNTIFNKGGVALFSAPENTVKSVQPKYKSFPKDKEPEEGEKFSSWGISMPTSNNANYIWQVIEYTYGDYSTAYSPPVNISIAAQGKDGIGIKSITEYYAVTGDNNPPNRYKEGKIDENVWKTSIADIEPSETTPYIWNFERTTYTGEVDGSLIKDTEVTLISSSGRAIESITEYYCAPEEDLNLEFPTWQDNNANHNNEPKIPDSWNTERPSVTFGKNVWNFELIKYSAVDSKGQNLYGMTTPAIAGMAGPKGDDGAVVIGEINQYYLNNNPTYVKDEDDSGENIYKLTQDKSVEVEKKYYIKNDDDTYTLIENPSSTANPKEEGWYEFIATAYDWIDITEGSTIPIVKNYFRFKRQKIEYNKNIDGWTAEKTIDGITHYYAYTEPYLDESDRRVVDWCSENDTTFIDGGHIYAHSISTKQLATDSIKSLEVNNDENFKIDDFTFSDDNPFTKQGSFFDLNTGNFASPSFSIWADKKESGVLTPKAYFKGHIVAESGSIGGWQITTDALYKKTSGFSSGMCSIQTKAVFSEGLSYALNPDDNSYTIIGIGSCVDTNVIIPSIYNNKPVTSIGTEAFYDCTSLTNIEIPDSVTSIGNGAFDGCSNLTTVFFGENSKLISIGSYAFYICSSLISIEIPASVTSIGSWAFDGCSSLTKVYYAGSQEDWNEITINSGNTYLENATRYYLSSEVINNCVSLVNKGKISPPRFFAGSVLNIPTVVEDAKFLVLEDGSLYASAASITGTIKAENGSIGPFELSENGLLRKENENVVLNLGLNSQYFKNLGALSLICGKEYSLEDLNINTSQPHTIIDPHNLTIFLKDSYTDSRSAVTLNLNENTKMFSLHSNKQLIIGTLNTTSFIENADWDTLTSGINFKENSLYFKGTIYMDDAVFDGWENSNITNSSGTTAFLTTIAVQTASGKYKLGKDSNGWAVWYKVD